jgi:hypothetical protein
MYNKLFIGIFSLMIISLIASCKKNDGTTTLEPTIAISINQPMADSTVDLGDTAHIDFSISSNIELHGYQAYLINLTANDTVWSAEEEHHSNVYIYKDDFWVNNVTDHSDMKFKVIAEIDHEGNQRTKEVAFHAHPD